MKQMIATKRLRYANRSMVAGDEFVASSRDADILVRRGSARYDTKDAVTDDLPTLRAEYQTVVGKKAYHGWDAETLKAKIAEAKE
ncbi:hypothetical protein CDV50_10275 [Haematobacter massiliensis]|uniref:hypothetical protein n=1 Tax=Haematobacter massiliensis TaxID=195105 RepID=UPI000B49C80A|nr:hypothetical protein [Haematobacter massiliensis]OWJ71383.1 hypothetical protein CDV50_10275 [Haematobacter massiliensis]